MKRILCILTFVLILTLLLAGCACRHEWIDASCDQAQNCRLCGERRGSALGHDWAEATCTTAKTCKVCGKVEGTNLTHNWVGPTCAAPKTCTLCGLTQDLALEHNWVEATCATPKTCATCGATDGAALGHSWKAATCTTAKICSICTTVEGKPLGHSWTKADCSQAQQCLLCGITGTGPLGHSWLDANCTEPVRCEYCDVTQGEPLGHNWIDATPESPKTCPDCGLTEGEPIYLDDRFIPADCEILFGSWQYQKVYTAEELDIPGFTGQYVEYFTYVFGPYGNLTILTDVADPSVFKAMLAAEMAASIYASQADEGRDTAAADEYWRNTYGCSVTEYANQMVEETTSDEDFNLRDDKVYYVTDDLLYTAMYWEYDFIPVRFQVEGDELTLMDERTGEITTLTRIREVTLPELD